MAVSCADITATIDNIHEKLREYGVAIIPSVLDDSECTAMNEGKYAFYLFFLLIRNRYVGYRGEDYAQSRSTKQCQDVEELV